ncbi:MAG TPA: glycosyltransferase family 2 protein [Polyangiaceae bacterium]|nr:glycosyltransferase family 2 protein [Polyangiaceae bacterium]
MSVVVVIPAYNAARHVRSVLERVGASAPPELTRIVVVNDGSTDATLAEVAAVGKLPCVIDLVDRERNGGYGAAMKDGLERARACGAQIVACIHADGQYSPEALPRLLAELTTRRVDVLQGSRIAPGTALSGGMPLYKYVANAVLNRIENRTLGLGMTDYHSGYLFYGRRALTLPFRDFSDSFDFDLEFIASARAHGLAIAEAGIPTHYGDEVSHLRPLSYGLRVLRVMWNYKMGRYGPT